MIESFNNSVSSMILIGRGRMNMVHSAVTEAVNSLLGNKLSAHMLTQCDLRRLLNSVYYFSSKTQDICLLGVNVATLKFLKA